MVKNYEEKIDKVFNEEKITYKQRFKGRKKYFAEDKEERNVYNIELKKDSDKINFNFGDSIYNTEKSIKPKKSRTINSLYEDSRYQGDTYEDVMDDYGYKDEKQAKKINKALISNREKYNKIFSEKAQKKLDKIYVDY